MGGADGVFPHVGSAAIFGFGRERYVRTNMDISDRNRRNFANASASGEKDVPNFAIAPDTGSISQEIEIEPSDVPSSPNTSDRAVNRSGPYTGPASPMKSNSRMGADGRVKPPMSGRRR